MPRFTEHQRVKRADDTDPLNAVVSDLSSTVASLKAEVSALRAEVTKVQTITGKAGMYIDLNSSYFLL